MKELRKLGKPAQRDIIAYLDERIAGGGHPRRFGKGLKTDLAGLWCQRVGDYRILCQTKGRGIARAGGRRRAQDGYLRMIDYGTVFSSLNRLTSTPPRFFFKEP
jgi:mRNA interferase RelE/StbE